MAPSVGCWPGQAGLWGGALQTPSLGGGRASSLGAAAGGVRPRGSGRGKESKRDPLRPPCHPAQPRTRVPVSVGLGPSRLGEASGSQ